MSKQPADSPWARISDYASRHGGDRATVRLFNRLPSVPASELCRVAAWFVASSQRTAEGYRAEYEDWRTQTAATPDDPAPVANDAEYAYVVPLRAAGIMWRFVHELLVTDPADAVLDQVERELDEHITQWSKDYRREFGVEPVRFDDTVGYQLKVILATALPQPDHDRPRHDGDAQKSGG